MVSARQKLRLVAAGTGVTFLPGSYLNLYSGVEGLVCYPLDRSLEGVWKLAVACPKEGKIPKSSRGFLRLLTETLGQMSVSGSLYFTEQAFHYMISNSSEGNVSKLRDRETQPGKRGEKPSERVCGF